MAKTRFRLLALALATGFCLAPAWVGAVELDAAPDRGVAALEQAYMDLGNDLTLLCLAAHPDDEDLEAMAYYRKKFGLRAITLLATRGEGGQNEIGSELYRSLGIVRTKETEAAAELVGNEVYYLNFEDFGYSKTAEETFEHWGGREAVVRRITEALRTLRPDIIITNHGLLEDHGNHQACGQAILDAFDRAGHPGWYQDGPAPYTPSKLYMRRWNLDQKPAMGDHDVALNVGEYDPIRGRSYVEIGVAALRMHRSQGLWEDRPDWKGPKFNIYRLIKSSLPDQPGKEKELTDGMRWTKMAQVPALDHIQNRSVKPGAPAIPYPTSDELIAAYGEEIRLLATEQNPAPDAVQLHGERVRKMARLMTLQNHIYVRATCRQKTLIPGQTAQIGVEVFNGGAAPIFVSAVSATSGWIPSLQSRQPNAPIGVVRPGEKGSTVLEADIPNPPGRDQDIVTQPAEVYWYARSRVAPLFNIRATVNLGDTLRNDLLFQTPAVSADPPARHALEWELEAEDIPLIPPSGRPAEVVVRVRNNSPYPMRGLRVQMTDPLSGQPVITEPFDLAPDGGEYAPPGLSIAAKAGALETVYPLRLELAAGELPLSVEAPPPLNARLHVVNVKVAPGVKVGLVKTYDDTHEWALRALGVDFDLLDAAALRAGDLARYDSIILSLRAYFDRPDVAEYNSRLLEYVKNGGNLIVAYNKSYEWDKPDGTGYAPYKLTLGRDRVTLEDAPMRILMPDHPHVSFPNRVTEADLDGWIQERSLYLPQQWSGNYDEVFECHDPGEPEHRGGHLTARYGWGTYTYTCYVWYRQLRNVNPGAFKVFANMISLSKAASPVSGVAPVGDWTTGAPVNRPLPTYPSVDEIYGEPRATP